MSIVSEVNFLKIDTFEQKIYICHNSIENVGNK